MSYKHTVLYQLTYKWEVHKTYCQASVLGGWPLPKALVEIHSWSSGGEVIEGLISITIWFLITYKLILGISVLTCYEREREREREEKSREKKR